MCKKLLFVDDEQNILNALNRTFLNSGYEVFLAASAAEALDRIKKTPIDLIMTDIRMPVMDGLALLRKVRKEYPQIIRTVLSGYSEKEIMMKLVMDGTAKIFMTKPWDNESLKVDISATLKAYENTRERGVLDIINSIENLPVLPAIYSKILKLIEKDADMSEIASCIETEQDYSARILRIINSAFFGIRTGSVRQAIVYLGLDTVKNIVLSSEAFAFFEKDPSNITIIKTLWEQSNLCNRIFHGLYREIHGKVVPEGFAAAGLLHDIGHLIILKYFPEEYKKIAEQHLNSKEKSIIQIEQEILGATHTQLGAHLLDWWNLPADMVDACLYHHGPFTEKMRNSEIIALIHLSDIYSWQQMKRLPDLKPDPYARSLIKSKEKELDDCVVRILHDK